VCIGYTSNQATTASFHILSNSLFINQPIILLMLFDLLTGNRELLNTFNLMYYNRVAAMLILSHDYQYLHA
jgi:hypothetical protein